MEENKYPRASLLPQDEENDTPKKRKLPRVGNGKEVKKGPLSKIGGFILGDIGDKNIGSYILNDVLLPSFRDTLFDMFDNINSMVFGGGKKRSRYYGNWYGVNHNYDSLYTNYQQYQQSIHQKINAAPRNRVANGPDGISIEYSSRAEANDVLSALADMTMDYGMVSVSELYKMSNMDPPYTAYGYGWDAVGDARVKKVRNGFVLEMPRPIKIER